MLSQNKGTSYQCVREPEHPYTQLLIGSIPMPDPDQKWQSGLEVVAPSTEDRIATMDAGYSGCQFADRCPHAMEVCQEAPPLYATATNRVVSCHLYENAANH